MKNQRWNNLEKGQESFERFKRRIDEEFLQHPIVIRNLYTSWFQHGEISFEELRHFTVQFSVFSNQFLIAQLKKMINADSVENMRAAKEILANEIGVIFKNHQAQAQETEAHLVGTEGSIEGGTFRFRAAHFEWLLDFAKHLELNFNDIGKLKHATASTQFFCRQLERFYGSEDQSESSGASFAIENWAAAGFWEELISGLRHFKSEKLPQLPLGFFLWHAQLEAQHAQHTHDELASNFFREDFNEEKFIRSGRMVLDALAEFWEGLDRDRLYFQEKKRKVC